MAKADYSGAQSTEESYGVMEGFIRELDERSRFQRTAERNGKTRLENKSGSYILETISKKSERENKRTAKKLYEYLMSVFDESEVVDVDTIESQINQGICEYHVIRDTNGEIISLINTQIADVVGAKKSHDQTLCVWYIVTSREHQGKGLTLELYRAAYQYMLDAARQNNKRISSIIGEAVSEVESILNKMGRKRPYFYDKDGNLCEVPFPQAPIDADMVDEEPPQEHMMIRFLDDRNHCSVADILALVKTVFAQYTDPRYDDLYDTELELESVQQATKKLYREVKKHMTTAAQGDIFLLSAKEREEIRKELEQKGKRIIEVE